jgi:hypothetical protein
MANKDTQPCERGLALLDGYGDGSYVTWMLGSLAHLAMAYCQADLSNLPGVVRAATDVYGALIVMGRGRRAEELIGKLLGTRPMGGRGTEMIEAMIKLRREDEADRLIAIERANR